MQLSERFGDGKAKAGALMSLDDVTLDLFERTSEPRQRLFGDADPGVGDGDARLSGG
jgi:hypothetical protein